MDFVRQLDQNRINFFVDNRRNFRREFMSAKMGAILDIQNRPGEGTRITFEISA